MRYFDGSFVIGTALALVATATAYLALTNSSLLPIRNEKGVLIAIAVIGFFSCSIGGISHATELGWTHPIILFGSAVGIVAIVIVGAGLLGWDGLLRPVAQFAPAGVLAGAPAERLAIATLATIIAVKWAADVAFAGVRSLSAG